MTMVHTYAIHNPFLALRPYTKRIAWRITLQEKWDFGVCWPRDATFINEKRSSLGRSFCVNQTPKPRWFSTDATPRRNPLGLEDTEEEDSGRSNDIVLFERTTPPSFIERASFCTATVCSVFFVWYVVDFVPAGRFLYLLPVWYGSFPRTHLYFEGTTVNSSGIPELYIHPVFPGLGIAGALIFQVGSTFYPVRNVSKLMLRQSTTSDEPDKLLYYVHTLPFVRPSVNPLEYPVGEFTLNPNSAKARKVVEHDNISTFKGHIPLYRTGTLLPFVLNINTENDVVEPTLLLESIMRPSPDKTSIVDAAPHQMIERMRRKRFRRSKKRR